MSSYQPGHHSPSLPAPHERCTPPGVPQITLTRYVSPPSHDVDVPPHPQPSGKARKSSSLAERSKSIQALLVLYLWTQSSRKPSRFQTIGGSAGVHGFLSSRPRHSLLALGGGRRTGCSGRDRTLGPPSTNQGEGVRDTIAPINVVVSMDPYLRAYEPPTDLCARIYSSLVPFKPSPFGN